MDKQINDQLTNHFLVSSYLVKHISLYYNLFPAYLQHSYIDGSRASFWMSSVTLLSKCAPDDPQRLATCPSLGTTSDSHKLFFFSPQKWGGIPLFPSLILGMGHLALGGTSEYCLVVFSPLLCILIHEQVTTEGPCMFSRD